MLDSTLDRGRRSAADPAAGARSCVADSTAALPRCRSVLMVGPDLASLGGIRAVVQGYRDGGLFERFPITYVATHRDGAAWRKLARALGGWMRAAVSLATLDAPLVHVHTASRASFWRKSVVCRIARLAGRPYILHLHGGGFARFYHEECGAFARRIVRSVLAHAAIVLAVSEQWRTELERICPEARVEVLPNAVALPPHWGAGAAAKIDVASRSAANILFLGQLHAEKGVFDLVRAFAAIASRIPRSSLVLAGHGAASAVEGLARELGVVGRVHCPGWLEQEAKGRALADADLFVLPSYTEGLPMALLEAMAWGLPVIASPVGGIPQVITHEVNGLLVPPGDIEALSAAIDRLMRDSSLRQRLRAAARATIEARFSLPGMIEQLLRLYERFRIEEPPAARGAGAASEGTAAREGTAASAGGTTGLEAARAPAVLFLVNSLQTGGAERQLVSLLNHLDARRFRLHLAYLKRNEQLLRELERERLAELLCLNVAHRLDGAAVRRLRRLVTERRIDAIVCTNTYPLLYGHLARRSRRARAPRLAAVFHTTSLRTGGEKARMLLYRPLFNRCDRLIYVCESQRRHWRDNGLHPIADHVIYNGIDTDWYSDSRAPAEQLAFRRSLGFGDEDFVVGLCGSFRPEKAHGDLLAAAASLRSRAIPAKVLLIGDGPERPAIERRAAQLGIREHIVITGMQQDVRPFVRACDVMTLVSHAIETFSLAALESMSLGKPLVMSNLGGAGEQVIHGEHGFLFAPGDIEALAMHLRALTSRALRTRFGDAGARRVRERFTIQAMTASFTDCLEGLTEGREA